jgi:UDP-N-acetylglucosamine--N-acetylmuramyl-(pentapeptide) pyrophosphoryl-undecaprenol N-acetylglucosamine transferase
MSSEDKKRKPVVAIAGGGTGGHLYPGLALAESFKDDGGEVHFVGTKNGIEFRVIPREGYQLHLIPVRGIKRTNVLTKIMGLLILPAAFFKSIYILLKIKPDLVVGVGGYASGPFVMTAAFFGYKTAILEQNTIPGVTNKLLGKVVKKVYVSFEESKKFFPNAKIVQSGNPVRKNIVEKILNNDSLIKTDTRNLLIFGGSLGAHTINTTMAKAAELLKDSDIKIRHQTGKKDLDEVKSAYENASIDADVTEFIYDMSQAYEWADLIVCRAGATTLAELTISGKPAILIPFPYATDNHQELNGLSLVKAGGAICLVERELDAKILTENIIDIMNNNVRRVKMGKNMTTSSRPEAANQIKNDLLGMLAPPRDITTTKVAQ